VDTGAAFAVTSPNTAVSWSGAQTVTWNVAGTTANGINAANVNILLSTDGGQTFPVTLASNTANDGSEGVTIPNLNSTTARVRIEPTNNIFFDISDADSTVSPATDVDYAAAPPSIDDSAGNGNGDIDPSERISLDVNVSNTGTALSGAITATLTSLTGTVTIFSGNASYPGLLGGGPGSPGNVPFLIDVGAAHSCGAPINLRLSLVSAELSKNIDITLSTGAAGGPPTVFSYDAFGGGDPIANLVDGGTATVSLNVGASVAQ
jgi:hypothetical protein